MIEHMPRAFGKFRVLLFPIGALLSTWKKLTADPNDPRIDGDWAWDASSSLVLPKSVKPIWDSGWAGNLVVTTGKVLTQKQVFGLATTPVDRMGVGDNATPPAIGQTALLGTNLLQVFDALPTILGNVISAQTTFAGGSTAFQWNEAAMFAGPGNGPANMLNRVTGFGSPTPGGAAAVAAWTYTQL